MYLSLLFYTFPLVIYSTSSLYFLGLGRWFGWWDDLVRTEKSERFGIWAVYQMREGWRQCLVLCCVVGYLLDTLTHHHHHHHHHHLSLSLSLRGWSVSPPQRDGPRGAQGVSPRTHTSIHTSIKLRLVVHGWLPSPLPPRSPWGPRGSSA